MTGQNVNLSLILGNYIQQIFVPIHFFYDVAVNSLGK